VLRRADLKKGKICRETRTVAGLFRLGGNGEIVTLPPLLWKFLLVEATRNIAHRVCIIFGRGRDLSESRA
jgi:hypothetical protein